MADTIEFKRGDTAATVKATLFADDEGTQPLDLTNATAVKWIMATTPLQPGNPKVNAPATIVLPKTDGRVDYTWLEADVDTAGTYLAEFEVTWSDGTVQTYPRSGYLNVTITEDLD